MEDKLSETKSAPWPGNGLTNAQLERLYILSEELGEAQQAVGKILRHGYESGWNGSNNRDDLEKELGHVKYACSRLESMGDVRGWKIVDALLLKGLSISPFLHYQHEDSGPSVAGGLCST